MTFHLTVIKPDGTIDEQTLTIMPSLEQLQEAVGGFIEPVPALTSYKGHRCTAYFDEEGCFKQLPTNWPATKLWHEALHATGKPLRQPLPELVGNLLIVCEVKS